MTDKVELNKKLVTDIINFLEEKPYKESSKIINDIKNELNKTQIQSEQFTNKQLLIE